MYYARCPTQPSFNRQPQKKRRPRETRPFIGVSRDEPGPGDPTSLRFPLVAPLEAVGFMRLETNDEV